MKEQLVQSCSRNAAGKSVFVFRNVKHSNTLTPRVLFAI